MKKNLTMQLMPLWLLAFFFFASVPIKAQTNSEATPRVGIVKLIGCGTGNEANKAQIQVMHDGTGIAIISGLMQVLAAVIRLGCLQVRVLLR